MHIFFAENSGSKLLKSHNNSRVALTQILLLFKCMSQTPKTALNDVWQFIRCEKLPFLQQE